MHRKYFPAGPGEVDQTIVSVGWVPSPGLPIKVARCCRAARIRVAQATRLCRPATRRTEREDRFKPVRTASKKTDTPQFRSAGRRPGRASRPRHPSFSEIYPTKSDQIRLKKTMKMTHNGNFGRLRRSTAALLRNSSMNIRVKTFESWLLCCSEICVHLSICG